MGNSRLILVEPRERTLIVDEPYRLLEVAMVISREQRLVLTCPPINRGDPPRTRSLDFFSKTKQKWLGTFDQTLQLLHKSVLNLILTYLSLEIWLPYFFQAVQSWKELLPWQEDEGLWLLPGHFALHGG